jgi:dihydroflavonol-4-reductase
LGLVLVTGASGHLGYNLVLELLKQGRKVRALINQTPLPIKNSNLEIVQGNVLDDKSLDLAFKNVEVVYHCAAKISIMGDLNGKVFETNVTGVANMAKAALQAKVKRFIHFSSCHAFAINQRGEVVDEKTPKLVHQGPAYDLSKAQGEQELQKAIALGLNGVILNPTGIIGPNDYLLSRMGEVFLKIIRGEFPALVEGGFDFVDVRDVVKAAIIAESKGKIGENYLLSGRHFTIRELSMIVRSLTGVSVSVFDVPLWLASLVAPFMEMYAMLMKVSPLFTRESLHALKANKNICHYKAQEELGFRPRDIKQTIRDIILSFEQRGLVSSQKKLSVV